jgi:hypothetical protein
VAAKKSIEKHLSLARRQRKLYAIIQQEIVSHHPRFAEYCSLCHAWKKANE